MRKPIAIVRILAHKFTNARRLAGPSTSFVSSELRKILHGSENTEIIAARFGNILSSQSQLSSTQQILESIPDRINVFISDSSLRKRQQLLESRQFNQ